MSIRRGDRTCDKLTDEQRRMVAGLSMDHLWDAIMSRARGAILAVQIVDDDGDERRIYHGNWPSSEVKEMRRIFLMEDLLVPEEKAGQ